MQKRLKFVPFCFAEEIVKNKAYEGGDANEIENKAKVETYISLYGRPTLFAVRSMKQQLIYLTPVNTNYLV